MTHFRLARSALVAWLVLFAVAFANGAVRVLVLEPRLGAAALPLAGGRPAQAVADTFTLAAVARGELFAPMVLWMAAIPVAFAWFRRGG